MLRLFRVIWCGLAFDFPGEGPIGCNMSVRSAFPGEGLNRCGRFACADGFRGDRPTHDCKSPCHPFYAVNPRWLCLRPLDKLGDRGRKTFTLGISPFSGEDRNGVVVRISSGRYYYEKDATVEQLKRLTDTQWLAYLQIRILGQAAGREVPAACMAATTGEAHRLTSWIR